MLIKDIAEQNDIKKKFDKKIKELAKAKEILLKHYQARLEEEKIKQIRTQINK